nr:uncharacterized protein LOC113392080 [Vanessa tameamea]
MRTFVTVLFSFFAVNHCFNSKWYLQRRAEENELNLNETYFPTLKNYHVHGNKVSESEYPWIARVVHSPKNFAPHVCTATCIDENIFITAARCVYILKVVYTSVIYQNQRLSVKAFVLPSEESKQLYDDIGFIVVNREFTGDWNIVETFNVKRPDNVFKWFEDMKFDEFEHKVVGYAVDKEAISKREVQLTELEVVIDIQLCREILSYNHIIVGFNVPCYHSCSYNSYVNEDERCDNYHGVLGGALFNVKSKKLFGIATWAAYYRYFELPVGFSVPNSDSYFKDHACSLKIRDSQETNASKGYYQKLCDNKRI